MGSKIGFLLSLLFAVQIMAYAGDLSMVQMIHSSLDACAVSAGKMIAIEGKISSGVISFVRSAAKANILPITSQSPQVGKIYEFKVFRSFQPLVISSTPMTITIHRSVVIGYLD